MKWLVGTLDVYEDKMRYNLADAKILFSIPYGNIISLEQYSEGEIKKKLSLGKAIAGGILFGPLGSLGGGYILGKEKDERSFFLKIDVNEAGQSYDVLFKSEEDLTQSIYQIKSLLAKSQIANKNENKDKSELTRNTSDKLRELLKMKEEGLITEEEFDAKKKQILESF